MSYLIIEISEGNIVDVIPTSSKKEAIKEAERISDLREYLPESEVYEWFSGGDNSSRVAVWNKKLNCYLTR